VPAVVGVPEICPLVPFTLSPPGNAPTVTLQLTGAVPPLEASVELYARFTSPAGSVAVVTVSTGALMVMLNAFVLVSGGLPESVTFTVKLEVPAVVGVPVIAPVLALRLNPAGKAPLVILHVNGETPPLSCSAALYAVPTVPLASDDKVTDGAGVAVMLSDAVLLVSLAEVAVSVTARFEAMPVGAV